MRNNKYKGIQQYLGLIRPGGVVFVTETKRMNKSVILALELSGVAPLFLFFFIMKAVCFHVFNGKFWSECILKNTRIVIRWT